MDENKATEATVSQEPKQEQKPSYNTNKPGGSIKPPITVKPIKKVTVYYYNAPVDFGCEVQSEIQAMTLIRQTPIGRQALAAHAVEIEINGQRKRLGV